MATFQVRTSPMCWVAALWDRTALRGLHWRGNCRGVVSVRETGTLMWAETDRVSLGASAHSPAWPGCREGRPALEEVHGAAPVALEQGSLAYLVQVGGPQVSHDPSSSALCTLRGGRQCSEWLGSRAWLQADWDL